MLYLVQDEREVLPPNSGATGASTGAAAAHGIEVAVEFKPVEHPTEPLDNDRPIQCPLPEPSILNVSLKLVVPPRNLLLHLRKGACTCACVHLCAVWWFALDRLVLLVFAGSICLDFAT